MPRTAEVIYVGDAQSIIRASQEAATAVKGATSEIEASAAKQKAAADATAKAHEDSAKRIQAAGKWAAVGIVAAAAGMVDAASRLEQGSVSIAKSGGISVDAAKKISDSFNSLGGKAEFTGAQMSAAFGSIAGELKTVEGRALNVAEANKVMNAAMDLTQATGGKLTETTEALGKVMLTYGINADGAAKVSDVLFSASKNTGVGLETLTQTLDRIRGRLGALAPSIEESAGLMDLLAQHGIQGRLVMSALNGSFTTLLGGSKATTAAAKELGLQVFDNSGKFVGLQSVIAQLQPKMAGLTQETQLQYTKALFGASANKQLLEVILQGPKAYESATSAASKSGATHEAAAKQASTFGGQLAKLKSALVDQAASIGQTLIPVLTHLATITGEVISWFKKHEAAAIALGGVIATVLGGAIGAFVGGKLSQLKKGLEEMMLAFSLLSGRVEASAGAMAVAEGEMVATTEASATAIDGALLGTGIGASLVILGTAAGLLATHWGEVMKGLEEASIAAANAIITVFNEVKGVIEGVLSGGIIPLLQEAGLIGSVIPHIGRISSGASRSREQEEERVSGYHPSGREKLENEREGTMWEAGKGGLSERSGSMMAFFEKNLGLSRMAAAGIVGNAMQESSLNPSKPGGGLFQYIGGRSASGRGSAYGQLVATQRELEGPYSAVLAKLRHAHSPEEAARIFSAGFEHPGRPEIGKRESYAWEAFHAHPLAHHGGGSLSGGAGAQGTETLPSIETLTKSAKAHKEKVEQYVNPLSEVAELHRGRVDQGVDFSGRPGSPIRAIGKGIIDAIIPNWFKGQPLVEELLTQGSHKGQHVYYAEQLAAGVHAGQHVSAGELIARIAGSGTGLELGFGAGGGRTLAQATTGYHEGQVTVAGQQFAKFLSSIGKPGSAVSVLGQQFEAEAKKALKEQTEDKKKGESELTRLQTALSSESLKTLQGALNSTHVKGMERIETALIGTHSSALESLAHKIASTYESALQKMVSQQNEAFRNAMSTLTDKLGELAKSGAEAWRRAQEKALGSSPEAKALESEKDAGEAESNARTEKDNRVALEKAQQHLKEAKWTGDKKQIKEAQEGVEKAEEAITQFSRRMSEKRREQNLEATKEGFEQQTTAYEEALNKQLGALAKQLETAKIDYKTFAAEVEAILSGVKVGALLTKEEQQAIEKQGGVVPKTVITPGGWVRVGGVTGHASGGLVEPGIAAYVGETGREMIVPTQQGRVVPAARAGMGAHAGTGGVVKVEGDMNVNNYNDVERFASRFAFRLRHG